jgi:hypothetical protein
MSKRKFTKEQIGELLKNANVVKCSEKSITYSKEFKVWAVKRYGEGFESRRRCPDVKSGPPKPGRSS